MADGAQTDLGERIRGIEVVIPISTQTHATPVVPKGQVLVAIEVPAGLDSSAITFTQCRTADGTYLPIYSDSGSAYSVTVTSSARHILVDPAKLVGVSHLKLVMGTVETSARTLFLILRRID